MGGRPCVVNICVIDLFAPPPAYFNYPLAPQVNVTILFFELNGQRQHFTRRILSH